MGETFLTILGLAALLIVREIVALIISRRKEAKPQGNPGHGNSQKLVMDQFRQIRETQTAIIQGLAKIEALLRDRLPK